MDILTTVVDISISDFDFVLKRLRFSCAKRESRDSAKLNFDGDRRVWDGITIKRKLPGSSAMYIVVEDEVHVDYSFSRNFLQILRL